MTRKLALLFLMPFLAFGAASGVSSAEKPTWGWKEDEGVGTFQKHPAPTPAWKVKTATPEVQPSPAAAAAAEHSAPPPPANVKSYCDNIADRALDARFIRQKGELERLETELAQKTALLEAKKAEFEQWMKRRNEFVSKAQENLVKLYSKIKPDAAAAQLAAMDEEAAAALLSKLSSKVSSAILDEMETKKAARLVSVMIGAARPSDATQTVPPVSQKAEEQTSEKQDEGQNGGKS